MLTSRQIPSLFCKGFIVLNFGAALAQNYPSKYIRIVTTSVGSGNDFAARLIANGISGPLGQSLVVANHRTPIIAAEAAAKAAPDGYSVLVHGGTFWILPLLQNVSYDVLKDFSPISQVARDVAIVVVHPSMPIRSVKELVALAKAKPGQLNFAVSNPGGTANLAGELFKSMTGTNIVTVPYTGTAAVVTAVISGEGQVTILDAGLLIPHVQSGKLRALAVTSPEPTVLVPGLPSVAATIPGYEHVGMTGVWVPAKTSAAIIARLHQEIVRYVNSPEAKERILNAGAEVVTNSPEEFASVIKADIARKGKLIRDVGLAPK